VSITGKWEKKFARFPIFVPREALEFAEKYHVEIDLQELALSAVAGYFATFASVAPDSRFPYKESHEIARLIQEAETPKSHFCPFCLLFSLDACTKESLAEDCDHCSLILNLRKGPRHKSKSGNMSGMFMYSPLSDKNTGR
jgi:hypothetical protein